MLRENNENEELNISENGTLYIEERNEEEKEITQNMTNLSNCESLEINNNTDRSEQFNFASTNARSIVPKMISVIENVRELELSFIAVTETWLQSSRQTRQEISDLKDAEDITMICRNRPRRGGGVALIVDNKRADFKEIKIKNNRFELLCCQGTVGKMTRKVVVFVIYLPPKMTVNDLNECCSVLSTNIEMVKTKYDDPLIIITGDFNKKKIGPGIEDYPDLKLIQTKPTRQGAHLDLVFTNFEQLIMSTHTLPPLESNDDNSKSDHDIIMTTCKTETRHHFTKKTITFRPYTARGEEMFGRMLLGQDWSTIYSETCDEAALKLTTILDGFMNTCFPEKTRIIKSTNLPWYNDKLARLSRQKKREYRRKRRSKRWKELEDRYQEMLIGAQRNFFEKMKNKAKEAGNSAEYFRAVAELSGSKTTEDWSVNEMFPGKSDDYIAEEIATYFNNISADFTPLAVTQPIDCSRLCPEIYQISARLRKMKKPKSRVPGDIFRQLISKYSDALAVPLFHVFGLAFKRGEWPSVWKTETVTVIPKCKRPTELSQLRNLSCTPLFSKLMESFVLDQIKKEIKLNDTQFGGLRGSSVNHFLIETWDEVLRALEDNGAAITLASIDFEKAFNRMSHSECLASAARLGASQPTLGMIKAFLTQRSMTVKVGTTKSIPKIVNGGSPQGSILANLLFCITTDQLNECAHETTLSFANNGDADLSLDENYDDRASSISPIRRAVETVLDSSEEEEELRASDFICFNPINRLYDSDLSIVATNQEIVLAHGHPEGWIERPLKIRVYIDDVNSIEKISHENATSHITTNKRTLKVHSPRTEHFFERTHEKSTEIGMKVNQKKTQLLCLSAAINDTIASYIRPTIDGKCTETVSSDTLKILGFHFDSRPTVLYHIRTVCQKFRSKLWSLRKLKRTGMSQPDLLVTYTSVLRPIIEFASPTYGPMLSADMANQLERLQLKAMKIVYGDTISYGTVLEMTTLETLAERREKTIGKFAQQCLKNPKYSASWFPPSERGRYETRHQKKYVEEKCRTSRLYNSPIFYMRRILNRLN